MSPRPGTGTEPRRLPGLGPAPTPRNVAPAPASFPLNPAPPMDAAPQTRLGGLSSHGPCLRPAVCNAQAVCLPDSRAPAVPCPQDPVGRMWQTAPCSAQPRLAVGSGEKGQAPPHWTDRRTHLRTAVGTQSEQRRGRAWAGEPVSPPTRCPDRQGQPGLRPREWACTWHVR